VNAEQYVRKYELKAFGRLMDGGPNELAKSMFGPMRSALVEALAAIFQEGARTASSVATLATVRAYGEPAAIARWELLYKARRRAMWAAALRVARMAAVVIAAAMGPDPVSYDEAGSGLDNEDALLVALLAAAGRSSADEREARR
jgi:hypothetical protein